MYDVGTLWAMVERDLRVHLYLQMKPVSENGVVLYYTILLRLCPRVETPTPWKRWRELEVVGEWYPTSQPDFSVWVWHRIFNLYSFDFPSEWPTDEYVPGQTPLPGNQW